MIDLFRENNIAYANWLCKGAGWGLVDEYGNRREKKIRIITDKLGDSGIKLWESQLNNGTCHAFTPNPFWKTCASGDHFGGLMPGDAVKFKL